MYIRSSFCLALLAISFAFSTDSTIIVDNPKVVSFANTKLPHEGILKQASDGLLYVELPEAYVFELINLMPENSISPPSYFEKGMVGAHISVAYSEEMKEIVSSKIPYLGEKVTFSIGSLEKVKLQNSKIGSEAYILTVASPQIVEIRKSLGLTPTIENHVFHITIAVNCKK